jgi:hypothetical protein
MVKVLEKLNIQYFPNKDTDSAELAVNEHWQTRARKLKNRKWRELNRKIMNDNHVAF